MTTHRFLPEALEEYEEAAAFYERIRPGLGASFILDFDQVIAATLEFPLLGSLVDGPPVHLRIRRRLLQRFGIEIDYMLSDDILIVVAVFHGKRRPGYWRDRLRRLQ